MEPTPAEHALTGAEEIVFVGLAIFAILAVAYACGAWLTRQQARLREERQDAETILAWLPIAQVAIWVLALVVSTSLLLDASPVVVLAIVVPATLMLVIAARDLVRDALAGVVLAFEHSILAGDTIDVSTATGEVRGKVIAVGVRRTLLRRADGDEVLIPNQTLLSSTVRTSRAHQKDAVVDIQLDVDVTTTAEFDRVREVARRAASISRFASPQREPEVHLEPDDESGKHRVTIQAFAFSPDHVRDLQTDVLALLNENLRQ